MLLGAVLGGVTVVRALPVFPGARGYGAETAAGRGTIGVPGSLTVYVVNSLGTAIPPFKAGASFRPASPAATRPGMDN
jgi:hypothetical protein